MSEKPVVVGYWISERKRQKLNWNEFQYACELQGLTLKQVDVEQNLDAQAPFHVLLHKLMDVTALAECGDQKARAIVSRVQKYISIHPELIVIDPLENIRNLCDRQKSYEIIQNGIQFNDVFTPNFVEISGTDISETTQLLNRNGIRYPFVCKPLIAQGSSDAHQMMIIFNEKNLKDCQPPCIAQDFINHNAILYKVFIVGEHFHVVERPSLKNFYPEDCASLGTIFFHSHDVSKSFSRSKWSILSEKDIPPTIKPNHETLERIVRKITKLFGLLLIGIDIVIENHTGRYGIIDVNAFPGYDGYPNFSQHLIDSIKKLLAKQKIGRQGSHSCLLEKYNCTLEKSLSDDLDSGFESDEKRKWSAK